MTFAISSVYDWRNSRFFLWAINENHDYFHQLNQLKKFESIFQNWFANFFRNRLTKIAICFPWVIDDIHDFFHIIDKIFRFWLTDFFSTTNCLISQFFNYQLMKFAIFSEDRLLKFTMFFRNILAKFLQQIDEIFFLPCAIDDIRDFFCAWLTKFTFLFFYD